MLKILLKILTFLLDNMKLLQTIFSTGIFLYSYWHALSAHFLMDMKLSHISTIASSYVVWCRFQNVICILRVGCDMNFRENVISLADKLRSPVDQVNYLQKNQIFPTSFNCPACDIVFERVNWKRGINFFYFRCPNYHL